MNIFRKKNAEPAGTVPELTEKELDKKFESVPEAERSRVIRDFLARTVKPRDAYGRHRVFDVAHHKQANRAERRARAKARGVRMSPGINKPFERA